MEKLNLKSLVILLIAAMAMFCVSCNDEDDDNDGVTASEIVGVWTVSNVEGDIEINGISFMDYLIDLLGMTQEEAEDALEEMLEDFPASGTITMNADGTYNSNFNDEVDSGTWHLSANGKVLTIDKDTEDEMVFDVTTLTNSKLVIEATETEHVDMNDDMVDELLEVTVIMTFTK